MNPTISCPGNLNFECTGSVPAAFTTLAAFQAGGGSASDNCALNASTFMVSESTSGTCPLTITRTYSIQDSCGNMSQCVQTITVDDSTNPVVNCPGNLNFECAGDVPAAFTTLAAFQAGGGSVSDNCGVDPNTFMVTENTSGSCPLTITRTYSIEDSCGNVGQCVQTIMVSDAAPPTVTCPGPLSFECIGTVPAAFATFAAFQAGGGSASDNCGVDPNTFMVSESSSGTCPRTITRTYSIADSCGNVGQCVQTITVDDSMNPTITCPGPQNFECIGAVPAAFGSLAAFLAGGGSASDNCGLNAATFMVSESSSGTCPRTIMRTYSIQDSCGNMAQCVQTITVDDSMNPTITCPGLQNFECIGAVPAAFGSLAAFLAGGGSASDNCGLVASTFMASESSSGNCPRTITRTYSIQDSCGNMAQCVQTITVDDTMMPTITCPTNINFECTGSIPAAFTTFAAFIAGGGSASDNCGLDQSTFMVSESTSGTCPLTVTRTYSIADSCGNVAQCIQTINVDDTMNPTISCPGNLNFECTGSIPPAFTTLAAFLAGGGSASDNCGLDPATFMLSESDNGTCPRTIMRTYSIEDSCGNMAQCVQTITVDDVTNPMISCPGNLSFECAGDVPAAFTTLASFIAGGGSASDNCGLDPATFMLSESTSGSCPLTITRTYSIEDSCGNVAQCVQMITVSDAIPPTVTCPGPLSFECIGDVPPAFGTFAAFQAGGGSASDNCGVDAATFMVSESSSGTCPRTITRTYSIADSCGNVGQCVQTITVDDMTPPTISCPGPQNFECIGAVPAAFGSLAAFLAGGGSASDNCGLNQSTFMVSESSSGTCPRTITRTYSIDDSCGNVAQCMQTITVDDMTPPMISCPGDLNFELFSQRACGIFNPGCLPGRRWFRIRQLWSGCCDIHGQ